MQVTTERQENCLVKLTISVDEDKTREYMQRAARTLSRRYRLLGFRPGKAPYSVVVRNLGIETVQGQSSNKEKINNCQYCGNSHKRTSNDAGSWNTTKSRFQFEQFCPDLKGNRPKSGIDFAGNGWRQGRAPSTLRV